MTSASMVIAMFGFNVNPLTYNIWLQNHDGYTSESLFYWSKIGEYTNNVVRDASPSGTVIDELNRGYPVIAETDYYEQHWVVIVGYEEDGQGNISYKINDPLQSSGPTDLSYNLTGDFHYIIAPVVGGYSNGWHTDGISQAFVDAYNFLKSQGIDLGSPASFNGSSQYVHTKGTKQWLMQYFYKENSGRVHDYSLLVYNPVSGQCYAIHSGFWGHTVENELWNFLIRLPAMNQVQIRLCSILDQDLRQIKPVWNGVR